MALRYGLPFFNSNNMKAIKHVGNNAPIVRTEYFEVFIKAGSTTVQFNLPDVQNLRNVHLIGLQLYTGRTLSKGINNQDVISVTDLSKGWLTLQMYNGVEAIKDYPMQNLVTGNVLGNEGGIINYRDFAGQRINWPKSYFRFNVGIAPLVDTVVPFTVYYRDPAAEEAAAQRANFRNRS